MLHERSWQWTSWTLQRPGQAPVKITARGVDRLREASFIARDGVLPVPGRLTDLTNSTGKITDAGEAWLAANAGAVKNRLLHFRVCNGGVAGIGVRRDAVTRDARRIAH